MKHQRSPLPSPSENSNKSVSTWALPEGAIHRIGEGKIHDIAFTADGDALVCGTAIGVWWYDLSTLSPIAVWETERGVVSTLAFSGCGDRLAVGNYDAIVKVLDVPSGVCITEIKRPQNRQFGWVGNSRIAFSADGTYLAASTQRHDRVHLWHAETGELLSVFSTNPEIELRDPRKPRPLIFSKDSRLLACAAPENAHPAPDFISVWDVSSGESVACLRGHTAEVYALSFSPCGGLLASVDESGILREWEIATGKEVRVCSEYAENFQVIPAYTASGELRAAVAYASEITVWDVDRREKLETFKHLGDIRATCFENGSHLAVASRFDFKVCRLGVPSLISPIPTHSLVPSFLSFSPDSGTLASVGRGALTTWNVATQEHRRIRHGHTKFGSFSFSAEGHLRALARRKDGTVSIWDVETKETIATLKEPGEVLKARWFAAPTGDLWASGEVDGQVHIYDHHGKQVACRGHTGAVHWLTFSPDAKRLASASRDDTARLWDVASGEEIAQLSLTWVLDDALYKYDLLKGHSRDLQTVDQSIAKGLSASIETIAFSPCGNRLAGGLSRQIRFWDVRTSDVVMSILLPRGCSRPFALAFSPCGKYLASGSWWFGTDKVSIRFWDVATGENITTLWSHPTDVQDLAFSPDGRLLASGSYDGTILLWDIRPYLRDETS
jgi:WD40 repeat protein